MNREYTRTSSFDLDFSIDEIFPLLCPKMEEKWIPQWECQVIYSLSGYNEPGAIFKTEKAFGTELIWHTNVYDKETGNIEFTNFAKDKFVFRFIIQVQVLSEKQCRLTFTHVFKPITDEGVELVNTYAAEDFQSRLSGLSRLLDSYLSHK